MNLEELLDMNLEQELEELRTFWAPAGLYHIASAVLQHMELMQDDRNRLYQEIATLLGPDRVPANLLRPGFIAAARNGDSTPEAVLIRLQEIRASRKRPGPPKGRPLKVRAGGDWTPQALKAELSRLGLSEVKLAKMLGINPKSVNKWSRTAIPDDRQEEISVVLKAYEEGLG
jgi:hypothetical protein